MRFLVSTAAWLATSVVAQTNIDLLDHVPLNAFQLTSTQASAVAGFSDADGGEYVLVTTDGGTTVFDVTDPQNPAELGQVAGMNDNGDKDVQVYVFDESAMNFTAYAYVTNQGTGDGGLQIIDLSDVQTSVNEVMPNWCPGFSGFTDAKAVTFGVKPSGFIGFVMGSDVAAGGLVALDFSNPAGPCDLGQWSTAELEDMYLASNWFDTNYDGTEVGIAFAATAFYLLDLSEFYDMDTMTNSIHDIAVVPGFENARSGWVTSDGRYLLVCDAGDELLAMNTRLFVYDLADITMPTLVHTWTGTSQAPDHHVNIVGNYIYLANSTRGLLMFEADQATNLSVFGDYDTFPANDDPLLDGAWESTLFPVSGTLAVVDRSGGLFLLDPQVPEDACRGLDLAGDGFDLGDLATQFPNWKQGEDVRDLIALISTCL